MWFLNPLADDRILGLPKLKAFADDKLNITRNLKVVFHRIENIVGKEENAGCQHFLLFSQCFQKAFSSNVSNYSYVPVLIDPMGGVHKVFTLSVSLFVYKIFNIDSNFWMVSDRAFIFICFFPVIRFFFFVPRSRSSVNVKLKYKGHISFKKGLLWGQ